MDVFIRSLDPLVRLSLLAFVSHSTTEDIGSQIGDEVDKQNGQISRITDTVEVNTAKAKKVTRRMDDLMD